MDIVEKIEKKANSEGWYFRRFPEQMCVGTFKEKDKDSDVTIKNCGRRITSGFVLAPGMNYPLCAKCAEAEFGS